MSTDHPIYPVIAAKEKCWSCNQRRAREDGLGLCSECRDRLIEEGRDSR